MDETAILYFSYRDRPGPSGHVHLRTRPARRASLADPVIALRQINS